MFKPMTNTGNLEMIADSRMLKYKNNLCWFELPLYVCASHGNFEALFVFICRHRNWNHQQILSLLSYLFLSYKLSCGTYKNHYKLLFLHFLMLFFFTCFKPVIENPCKSTVLMLYLHLASSLLMLSTTQNKYYRKYMQWTLHEAAVAFSSVACFQQQAL